MTASPIDIEVVARIGCPRDTPRTVTAAMPNPMTQTRIATSKASSCGALTRYTSQKLAAIWFPNDWTARIPIRSRYSRRRNFGMGTEIEGEFAIRIGATGVSIQRDFVHMRTGESVYTETEMVAGLRGSPSLVGRQIANLVRSAPGGSNPPPRAESAGKTDVDPFLRRRGPVRGLPVEHGGVRLGSGSDCGEANPQGRSLRHGRARRLRGGAGASPRPSDPAADGRPRHDGSGNRGRYRGRLLVAASLGEGLRPAPHGASSRNVPGTGYAYLDANNEPQHSGLSGVPGLGLRRPRTVLPGIAIRSGEPIQANRNSVSQGFPQGLPSNPESLRNLCARPPRMDGAFGRRPPARSHLGPGEPREVSLGDPRRSARWLPAKPAARRVLTRGSHRAANGGLPTRGAGDGMHRSRQMRRFELDHGGEGPRPFPRARLHLGPDRGHDDGALSIQAPSHRRLAKPLRRDVSAFRALPERRLLKDRGKCAARNRKRTRS